MPSKKIRTRTCPKCCKGIYRTPGAAITEIIQRISQGAVPLRYYRCPHADGANIFHITSQKKRSQ